MNAPSAATPGRQPVVAVIIPCHNAARHVGEAVATALGQTYPHMEVIVVDDGSTDDLAAAVAPFAGQIQVITQRNAGQGAARNRGMAATQADYLAFLDADDRWLPEKVARQVAALEGRHDCGLVHTARALIDTDGRPLAASPLAPEPEHRADGRCLLPLVSGNPIIASSVMVRRSLMTTESFATDLSGVEDWDMWLRLAARTTFARIDDPLTEYRVHHANFSWDRRVMARATVALMDRLLAREAAADVRAAAAAHRHEALLEAAHLEYERGNDREARRWFRRAAPRLGTAGILRFGATLMPPGVRTTARGVWRALRGSRSRAG